MPVGAGPTVLHMGAVAAAALQACALLSVSSVALTVAAAEFEDTFVDRVSSRRSFSGKLSPADNNAWPSIEVSGIAQLEPRTEADDQAWVLESGTGKVWLLKEGKLQPVRVNSTAVAVQSAVGSRLVSCGAGEEPGTANLAIAQPDSVVWLHCKPDGALCHEVASSVSIAGAVHSAAAVGSELYLGTTSGVARSLRAGVAPQLLPLTGGEPAVAVAVGNAGEIAVATAQTLWWGSVRLNHTWRHLGVGGVIDSNITALRYFSGGLAIGTAHALHVLDATGVVARFSGLQGLPVAGITSLCSSSASSNSSLLVGTTQGLVEMLPGVSDANATGANPEWRYYNSERWLVSNATAESSAVAALAMLQSSRTASGDRAIVVAVATAAGLAEIFMRHVSYEEKVAHYQSMVVPQHDRYGWTAQVSR